MALAVACYTAMIALCAAHLPVHLPPAWRPRSRQVGVHHCQLLRGEVGHHVMDLHRLLRIVHAWHGPPMVVVHGVLGPSTVVLQHRQLCLVTGRLFFFSFSPFLSVLPVMVGVEHCALPRISATRLQHSQPCLVGPLPCLLSRYGIAGSLTW